MIERRGAKEDDLVIHPCVFFRGRLVSFFGIDVNHDSANNPSVGEGDIVSLLARGGPQHPP